MGVKFAFALNWPHLVCRQIIGKRCLEGHHSGNVGEVIMRFVGTRGLKKGSGGSLDYQHPIFANVDVGGQLSVHL